MLLCVIIYFPSWAMSVDINSGSANDVVPMTLTAFAVGTPVAGPFIHMRSLFFMCSKHLGIS